LYVRSAAAFFEDATFSRLSASPRAYVLAVSGLRHALLCANVAYAATLVMLTAQAPLAYYSSPKTDASASLEVTSEWRIIQALFTS
jgi:hypothetical protein